ncbi:MAG: hypothetical protein U0Y10_27450 [Spirosomataceae bacterium]
MYFITVLYGSDSVRKFYNREIFEESELALTLKYYEFKTKAELEAFIYGLEEAKGWYELIYFKNEKLQPFSLLSVAES